MLKICFVLPFYELRKSTAAPPLQPGQQSAMVLRMSGVPARRHQAPIASFACWCRNEWNCWVGWTVNVSCKWTRCKEACQSCQTCMLHGVCCATGFDTKCWILRRTCAAALLLHTKPRPPKVTSTSAHMRLRNSCHHRGFSRPERLNLPTRKSCVSNATCERDHGAAKVQIAEALLVSDIPHRSRTALRGCLRTLTIMLPAKDARACMR